MMTTSYITHKKRNVIKGPTLNVSMSSDPDLLKNSGDSELT